MHDWETLDRYIRDVMHEAYCLKGHLEVNIIPKVVAAYVDGKFLLLDVQYHSYGYRALYEINLETGVIVLAQD